MKKRVLIFCTHYLPGHLAGGPVRSIANLVERLGDEFDFLIFTSNADFKQTEPYPGITSDQWCKVGKAQVYYASTSMKSVTGIKKILNDTQYDILYLNSFFDKWFSILPCVLRYIGMVPKYPIVLAPRGEFSIGALKLKALKKSAFIWISKFIGLYQGFYWQASTRFEYLDILRVFKFSKNNIFEAINFSFIYIAMDLTEQKYLCKIQTKSYNNFKLSVCFL